MQVQITKDCRLDTNTYKKGEIVEVCNFNSGCMRIVTEMPATPVRKKTKKSKKITK